VILRVVRKESAKSDLAGHYAHIGRDSPAAAERFLQRVKQTFELLSRFPAAGRAWLSSEPELRGMRFWAVDGFPNHLIFYRIAGPKLDVVRVLHASRDVEQALRE
jgi:toxin ParE1/3/4